MLMLKNTNRFLVFQDSSIPDVYGDICPCVCDNQTALHSILASVLSKQIKQYCLKVHAPGEHWTDPLKQDASTHTMCCIQG